MRKVKALVKKIDPYDKELRAEFIDEFIDDVVRNEGKVITLHDYYREDNGDWQYFSYKLKSENGVLWHRKGHKSGEGIWSGGEEGNVFNKVFFVIPDEELLDEDLFHV